MKKMSSFCLGLLGMVAMSIVCPQQAKALDSQYLRNGECYLLIGEGNTTLRGVYRLNNPAAQPAKYYKDNRVIPGASINNTLGFNVDLNRKIYTFTENVDASWSQDSAPLYRQVIDTVPANHADYGYHAWIHYDHRQWGKGNVYRTGPAGRDIRNNSGRVWSGFKSAGSGIPVTKPAGYTLPSMTGAAKCGEYPGKQWYQIPNYSWYSSWKTGKAVSHGYSTFYYVYGDRIQVKKHNYHLWTWSPSNAELDTPSYSKNTGNIVAITKEEKISRDCLAGCLDGCGGASGSGSAQPKPMLNDIAFQPPIKNQTSRTYFYSRTEGATSYKITKDNIDYNPGSGNPLIGKPDSTDTYWLCVSLKDTNSDYVYSLGTSVIKDWYKQATGSPMNNMSITAVTVSNQWDQQGGIVYAYDKANKKIYKFERKESDGTPVTKERFLALDMKDILSEISAKDNSELDDIKADGFGSLYFAMSHPSKNVNDYNPALNFKPSQCIHLHPTTHDNQKGEQAFLMIFKQDYGKKVFERNYLTGIIKEIGSKDYASRIYNVSCKIKDAGWKVIKNYPSGCNFSRLNAELASWTATVAGIKYTSAKTSWPSSYYLRGRGSCRHYTEFNYNDPGQAKLAVINVPTPPKVISLIGDKKSYLDICGPYLDDTPALDKTNRCTNQSDGLLLGKNILDIDETYYYMVENYPLPDGAQDPTQKPNDWPTDDKNWYDRDGRLGGFITSIKDSAYYNSEHPDGVVYEWKLWQVMNSVGKSICKLVKESDSSNCKPYFYISSSSFGKYILSCRVKYHWYDYDALAFGSTVDDLSEVLHSNVYAIPVSNGGVSAQYAKDRLNQIMNTFTYRGTNTGNKDVLFMKNPIDKNGKAISVDYNQIISDPDGNSKFFALEPISVGSTVDPDPKTVAEVALITRCDDIPGIATSTYLNNSSFWSKPPSDSNTFGVVSGEKYNWRIDIASQTNLFRDISKFTGTDPKNTANYNYVAHQFMTPGSDLCVNTSRRDSKGNLIEYKFLNEGGDLRWADNKIIVSAKLIYYVPDNSGNKKPITVPLVNSMGVKADEDEDDYDYIFEVKPESVLWTKNIPICYTTDAKLPPTDPFDAKIQIVMSREASYDRWKFKNGSKEEIDAERSRVVRITGEANIRIMDTNKPRIAWNQTSPNNLFGITGGKLEVGVGPTGQKNPNNIYFTITDNNPWEAVETETGLSLDQHIKNFAYNFGYDHCTKYCASNSVLLSVYKSVKNTIKGYTGIKNQIQSLKDSAKKSKTPVKTSHLNYKPLFSRAARDVRLSFDTVKRDPNLNPKYNGKVIIGKADELYSGITARKFEENTSGYAVHYHNGSRHQDKLLIDDRQTSQIVGATTVYTSSVKYRIPIRNILIGTDRLSANNIIPDGYANNTLGYATYKNSKINAIRPYKFYLKAGDSSGNYWEDSNHNRADKELNLVLHVKDDRPPVGYGSMFESKYKMTSYFPYQNVAASGKQGNEEYAPKYSIIGEKYFASSLLGGLATATEWIPSTSDSKGYINNVKKGVVYQAMESKGDDISINVNDSVFEAQVKEKLSPLAVEDNVECSFKVWASDNCGNATSTLTIKYYSVNKEGKQSPVTKTINSWWLSEAKENNVKKDLSLCIPETDNSLFTLFRGNSDQFPMALPITIVTEDNARDWDYYIGGNPSDDEETWKWGTINVGKDAHNKRIFKTSVPVFGSELDIRTLDKTIQNQH